MSDKTLSAREFLHALGQAQRKRRGLEAEMKVLRASLPRLQYEIWPGLDWRVEELGSFAVICGYDRSGQQLVRCLQGKAYGSVETDWTAVTNPGSEVGALSAFGDSPIGALRSLSKRVLARIETMRMVSNLPTLPVEVQQIERNFAVQVVFHEPSGLPVMLLTEHESGEPVPVDPRFVMGALPVPKTGATRVDLDGDMSCIFVRESPDDVWSTTLRLSEIAGGAHE